MKWPSMHGQQGYTWLAVTSLVVGLAACGGGGGGADGSVSSTDTALAFNGQPVGQTVTVGQTATFTVALSGSNPSYQWQVSVDGGATFTSIAGATSPSYAVNVSTPGQFYVRVLVANGAGAALSQPAVLTAAPALNWSSGQRVSGAGASVTGYAADMDATGRVVIVFKRNDGTREALFATRGTAGSVGTEAVYSSPVALDTLAPLDASGPIAVSVSPQGEAVARWTVKSACSGNNYATAGDCLFQYVARMSASTGSWDAPILVADTPNATAGATINDNGDIAVGGVGWERIAPSNDISFFPAVFWKRATDSNFRQHLFRDASFSQGALGLDQSGRMVLAGPSGSANNFSILAYRGNVSDGFGAGVSVGNTDSASNYDGLWLGLNGQAVLLWSQATGGGASTRRVALMDDASADLAINPWVVSDLGLTPSNATRPQSRAVVTNSGGFIRYDVGTCKVMRRAPGGSIVESALDSRICAGADAASLAVNGRGDLLAAQVKSGVSDVVGGRWTMVSSTGSILWPYTAEENGYGYLLGTPSTIGGSLLLSDNAVAAFVSSSSFDTLPSLTAPAGIAGNVVNLWSVLLQPVLR